MSQTAWLKRNNCKKTGLLAVAEVEIPPFSARPNMNVCPLWPILTGSRHESSLCRVPPVGFLLCGRT